MKFFKKKEKGQSVVEFALVLPMLLLLLGMIVDVGRVLDAKILIENAACESIRQINSRSTMVTDVNNILNTYYDRIDSTKLVKSVTGTANATRNYTYHAYKSSTNSFVSQPSYITYFDATVELTYTVNPLTPIGKLMLGNSVQIKSKYIKMIYVGGFTW